MDEFDKKNKKINKDNKPNNDFNGPKKSGNGKNGKNNKQDDNVFRYLIFALLVTVTVNMIITSSFNKKNMEIRYDQFAKMVQSGYVEEVEIQYDRLIIVPKPEASNDIKTNIFEVTTKDDKESDTVISDGELVSESGKTEKELKDAINKSTGEERIKLMLELNELSYQTKANSASFYTGRLDDANLISMLETSNVKFSAKVTENNVFLNFITEWILPIFFFYMIIAIIMYFMSKRMGGSGGIMGAGKSNHKRYNKEDNIGVSFDDVAGQEEAKESLEEIIDFLNKPEKYREIGATQPKGALLVGPPGTGKTLLAKAVAGESNATFLSLTGSEFIEMYVGVGASRVRDLFKEAKKSAPCIIFIDEIDAIGKSRDSQMGSNDEREQTLNQLLSEMDGFDSRNAIVILAATNRPEVLDKALLRPGRFDRQIIVEKPDLKGRIDILKVHLKKVKYEENLDLNRMALATAGATGADIANMVNEAALMAVRQGRKEVTEADLLESVEVIIAGKEKKDRIMSEKERKIVAYHEVGHALAAALQTNSQPVQKITIVPRTKGSLGYTMQMPEEEKFLSTKDELTSDIVTFLAGRAAEDTVFNVATTGASNDIERATETARRMVTMYGMSDKFKMMGLESVQSRYLDGRRSSNCSDITLKDVDEEVRILMEECYYKAREIVVEYRDALDEIAEYLLGRETISGDEFMKILKKYKPDLKLKQEEKQISISDFEKALKEQEEPKFEVEINDDTKVSSETDNKPEDDKSDDSNDKDDASINKQEKSEIETIAELEQEIIDDLESKLHLGHKHHKDDDTKKDDK